MTDYIQLVRMAPAAIIDVARSMCAMLAEGDAGDGELTTGLVPTGSKPGATPTWYITDGPIARDMADAMLDPEVMHELCVGAEIPYSIEQCQALLVQCVFAEGGQGLVLMAEMGLELAMSADKAV